MLFRQLLSYQFPSGGLSHEGLWDFIPELDIPWDLKGRQLIFKERAEFRRRELETATEFDIGLDGFATMLAIHENKEEELVAVTENVQVA